jgi:hypothetical protein
MRRRYAANAVSGDVANDGEKGRIEADEGSNFPAGGPSLHYAPVGPCNVQSLPIGLGQQSSHA